VNANPTERKPMSATQADALVFYGRPDLAYKKIVAALQRMVERGTLDDNRHDRRAGEARAAGPEFGASS